jgi:hypothetical protein
MSVGGVEIPGNNRDAQDKADGRNSAPAAVLPYEFGIESFRGSVTFTSSGLETGPIENCEMPTFIADEPAMLEKAGRLSNACTPHAQHRRDELLRYAKLTGVHAVGRREQPPSEPRFQVMLRALRRGEARVQRGKYKIRVNTILPSALTPKSIWYLKESKTYDSELAKVAMGRFGTPDDIAPTAVFLASDESNFVTGQTIGVDGGSTIL